MATFTFPRLLAYGDGGFRFSDGRREGSVSVINGEVAVWRAATVGALEPEDFDAFFAADPRPDFVLLGTGRRIAPAPEAVRARFRAAAFGLEVMDTPAASRVYSTLLNEGRRFAAALIAI